MASLLFPFRSNSSTSSRSRAEQASLTSPLHSSQLLISSQRQAQAASLHFHERLALLQTDPWPSYTLSPSARLNRPKYKQSRAQACTLRVLLCTRHTAKKPKCSPCSDFIVSYSTCSALRLDSCRSWEAARGQDCIVRYSRGLMLQVSQLPETFHV